MLPFLQSNVSLVVGALLVVLLAGTRALTSDKDLRRDLRGALALLVAFVGFRSLAWLLPEATPAALARAVQVAWMLTFAFGCIRVVVALGLRAVRLRSATATPKILRDVIDFTLYALAALPILKSELKLDLTGLVATSAVLSVVIGLALQETLHNLFAGLSLQIERPFQVGDFVKIGEFRGVVAQIGWRATRIETFRNESITLPNAMVGKEAVVNFTRGVGSVGVDHTLTLSYEAAPNRVKALILETLRELPLVLEAPAPSVRTQAFDASGVRYMMRFFVADYLTSDGVIEELNSRLWYRLRRERIEIPYPTTVFISRRDETHAAVLPAEVEEVLEAVDLFQSLDAGQLEQLQRDAAVREFGRGEPVITEGGAGQTFYVVARGEVSVRAGGPHAQEVARLRRGQYFGEMSLLTGEKRSATVVAATDAVLLELDRPTFSRLFEEHPGLARRLSALLAQRRQQLRAVSDVGGGVHPAHEHTPEASRILTRLKSIFGLSQD